MSPATFAACAGSGSSTSTWICTSPRALRVRATVDTGSDRGRCARARAISETEGRCGGAGLDAIVVLLSDQRYEAVTDTHRHAGVVLHFGALRLVVPAHDGALVLRSGAKVGDDAPLAFAAAQLICELHAGLSGSKGVAVAS